jgi:site-specific DNA-cytosine methylase
MYFEIADLYCGAGGSSSGAIEAYDMLGLKARLTALNHSPRSIATHQLNHAKSRHFCADVMAARPTKLYLPGLLHLLWASPACTFYSRARGGKPICDQMRVKAWAVVRWLRDLRPPFLLVENVPDFRWWGPLHQTGALRDRPIEALKGKTFDRWVRALRAMGYLVEWRIIRCANYGDPTIRERLIIQAVLPPNRIVWPNPTHGSHEQVLENPALRPWRTARTILDLSDRGLSIFNSTRYRKHPVAPNTLRRILTGLLKFSDAEGEPYLVNMKGQSTAADVDLPAPTITAGAPHLYLAQPCDYKGAAFILPKSRWQGDAIRSLEVPLQTVDRSSWNIGFCQERSDFQIPLQDIGDLPKGWKVRGRIRVPDQRIRKGQKGWAGKTYRLIEVEGKRYLPVARAGRLHLVDIHYRMLRPRELARAQGFADNYQFTGNQEEVVSQIGNAVPRHTARALVYAVVSQCPDVPWIESGLAN